MHKCLLYVHVHMYELRTYVHIHVSCTYVYTWVSCVYVCRYIYVGAVLSSRAYGSACGRPNACGSGGVSTIKITWADTRAAQRRWVSCTLPRVPPCKQSNFSTFSSLSLRLTRAPLALALLHLIHSVFLIVRLRALLFLNLSFLLSLHIPLPLPPPPPRFVSAALSLSFPREILHRPLFSSRILLFFRLPEFPGPREGRGRRASRPGCLFT